jgi:hypothetical protein
MRALPCKARSLISLFIAYVPSNLLRIALHRQVNRCQIDYSARIGKAVVRWFNRFEGPFALVKVVGAVIGPPNHFTCLFDAPKNEDGTPQALYEFTSTLNSSIVVKTSRLGSSPSASR